MRAVLLLLTLPGASGCGLVGPSCLDRQERGTVTTIQGEIAAGRLGSHVVQYDSRGSQNDAIVSWSGQSDAAGPRIAVYATRPECTDFSPSSFQEGACAVLGMAGWIDGHLTTSFAIANGRGNPDILGTPPRFKLWVVGDSAQNATYSIRVTWFYGPDC